MTTSKNIGVVLNARDRAVLRTLVIARVLDAEEMKTVGGFTSIRRTNRRLLKLVRAGVLRRWFVGTASGGQKALYGLSSEGARIIGESGQGLISWKQDSLITTSQFLAHQQAINRVFLLAQFRSLPHEISCRNWRSFREPISDSVPLMPDGYFDLVQDDVAYAVFLEADLGTESTKVWDRKVKLYLKLAFSHEFEPSRVRVIAVFPTERRMDSIRRLVAKHTEKLFWFSTEGRLQQQGLCGRAWLRPKGRELVALP